MCVRSPVNSCGLRTSINFFSARMCVNTSSRNARTFESSRSGAVVEQTQLTGGFFSNHAVGDIDMTAAFGAALQDASGNLGVNIAAGVGNAQSNDAALSSITDENGWTDTYASAMVFSD